MPLFNPPTAAASGVDAYTAMLGLVAQPFPLDVIDNDNLGATSGFLLLSLIRPGAKLISNLGVWLTTAGTAPGSASMALFSADGSSQLAVTGDMSTALTTAGNDGTHQEAAVTVPFTASADTNYYVGLFTALTADAKIGGAFSGAGLHLPTVKGNRPAIVVGGLGAMPSTVNVAGATTAAAVYWLTAS
ncbi:MAG TPA: hypothetical protein VFU74_21980 [Actinocrinis sp.]|nr:hypothetical protein [Actinocrinis sp.]